MKGTANQAVARLRLAVGEWRRELGLSQAGTARLAGVSPMSVARIENGSPHVSDMLVVQVAVVLLVLEMGRPLASDLEAELQSVLTDAGDWRRAS